MIIKIMRIPSLSINFDLLIIMSRSRDKLWLGGGPERPVCTGVIALFHTVIYSDSTGCILLLGVILFLLITIVFHDLKTSAL